MDLRIIPTIIKNMCIANNFNKMNSDLKKGWVITRLEEENIINDNNFLFIKELIDYLYLIDNRQIIINKNKNKKKKYIFF